MFLTHITHPSIFFQNVNKNFFNEIKKIKKFSEFK
jgi:hypothetical protein